MTIQTASNIATSPAAEAILLTEQPFLKVPFEEVKRIIRQIQKIYEKELGLIFAFFIGKSATVDLQDVNQINILLKGIDSSKKRLESLAIKVSSLHPYSYCFVNRCPMSL